MAHFHAVIWIDHREARIFHFNPTDADRLVVHPHDPTRERNWQRSCGRG